MAAKKTTKKSHSKGGGKKLLHAKRRRNILISLGVGLLIVAAGSFVLMSRAATTYTQFVGVGGKCLDNHAQRKVNGNKIQLWDCNTSSAQKWKIGSNGTITNANGYCLDTQDIAEKSLAQLRQCSGSETQLWKVANNTISHRRSGLCLDDKSGLTTNGNTIWLYRCNGTAAQKWTARNVSGGTPSTTAPSGQKAPVGDLKGWKQVFVDDFTGTVPKGAFSDCNHNTDSPKAYCGGLKKYGAYYQNWWAYPSGWKDTAKSGADGNTGAPFGGTYRPEHTVSVSSGAMHINMYRPTSGGDNHVAAVVPRKCMELPYGRYTERFKVIHANPGFKSAHLLYNTPYEIDFPENDYGVTISAFTHPGENNFHTKAKWTSWHTTVIEWNAGKVKYYLDGKLIGTATKKIPPKSTKLAWVLQNESSIMGPYAKPGAKAQLDIDWVACYKPM